MGNRYGRNQKRKAKAALAEAAAREAGLRALWNRTKNEADIEARERRHLEQQIRDAQEVLGRAFIAFDPVTQRENADWRPYLNVRDHMQPPYQAMDYSSCGDVVRDLQHKIRTLQGVKFDALRDRLAGYTHYRVEFRGRKVGYYISDEAIFDRCVPYRLLEERAFREIAHAFTGELEKLRDGNR